VTPVIRVDWEAWAVTAANARKACGSSAFLMRGAENDGPGKNCTEPTEEKPCSRLPWAKEPFPGMLEWLKERNLA